MYLNNKLSNILRILSIDAIEKAKSGHPGAPMGMADISEVLWRKFIKHNPSNPLWDNRDRFILSNGHASILLYSILHLTGYDITINDLKKFRQFNSKTPGHPEINNTPGVEITTGPLGQGLGNGVGMAISEYILSKYFNRKNYKIVDHYTWVFVGDGCIMEGISHEVCSLAGTLKLNKLIVLYDSNGITIDGRLNEWCNDNTKQRFLSYNWNVISNIDGHNKKEIYKAIKKAKSFKDKPSIIIFNTIIGLGSPNKCNSSSVHGAPLGEKEIILVRKTLNWKYNAFEIPKFFYKKWNAKKKGFSLEKKWNILMDNYKIKYPKLYSEYVRRMNGFLPCNFEKKINDFFILNKKNKKFLSTRQISKNVLEFIGPIIPELIGGSADLTPSNLTKWSGCKNIVKSNNGNYIHYGVREFGMTTIANGMFHHKGLIPYIGTFLIFSDYARNAIRMASLMKTKLILIYTHDSIGLGEDGPTHHPIEQLSSLRLIPKISIWRPCNNLEVIIAWKYALKNNGPTALILSRQELFINKNINKNMKHIEKGAYIIKEYLINKSFDVIIISTGSEIEISLKLAKKLFRDNYSSRVISMPSCDFFDKQNNDYKKYLFPYYIKKRIVIEAGVGDYWYKYVGINGLIISINKFAKSAPSKILFDKFGFNLNNIFKKSKLYLSS